MKTLFDWKSKTDEKRFQIYRRILYREIYLFPTFLISLGEPRRLCRYGYIKIMIGILWLELFIKYTWDRY